MQIVGYRARVDDHAALVISEDGAVRRERLSPGTELAYTLRERRCAGTIHDDRHYPCESATAPYCDQHTDRWPCARCTGDCDRPLNSCDEEHAVYLAAFAPDIVKVGVTRSWRLRTRLREQGADRAAHVRTVADGRTARRIEAGIAADIGDQVRTRAKIDGFDRRVDGDAWEALIEPYDPIETFAFDYGLGLDERPMTETMATGTVRGTKGRVVALDRGGSTYAVDLRSLVGHEVERGRDGRRRQSSLGAFEG